MIDLSTLAFHPSSPARVLNHLADLQKREDLYSPDNFYFGFESSNSSFLNIMNAHMPLAIKYGATFMIYNRSLEGSTFDLYWIDDRNEQLFSLITIKTKPKDSDLIKTVLPVLVASYMDEPDSEQQRDPQDPCSHLGHTIEQLTIGSWPNENEYEQLITSIGQIQAQRGHEVITCSNLLALQHQLQRNDIPPSAEDFVTPYSLVDANPALGLELLFKRHPSSVTVRPVYDEYPRIDVLIPDEVEEERYMAVYKRLNPALFLQLEESLADTRKMSNLLREHFPDKIARYFTQQEANVRPQ